MGVFSNLNAFAAGFGIAFGFCIDSMPISNTVVFNSNTGTGSMENQILRSNEQTALTLNSFTKTGYRFAGWNTNPEGTGTSYTDGQMLSNLSNTEGAVINLYAQWEINPTKYAVQIYGINQDEDSAGNTLGLTFGPAIGANYNNSYVTHKYEEITGNPGNYYVKIVTHTVAENSPETTSEEYLYENGGTTTKVTRTTAEKNKYDINMHNMTWTEIAAVTDKTAFLDCMLCGDTKSVELSLNNSIEGVSVHNQYGDGAGMLHYSIITEYRKWNPSPSDNSYVGTGVTLDNNEQTYGSNARNAGGYASSHMRATLIGENSKTNKAYAGDVNLDTTNSLYTCIKSDLRNLITAKKVKYVTGTYIDEYNINDDISDKIWLFSNRELYGTGEKSGFTAEGIGSAGNGYDKFGNNKSKYYISSYNNNETTSRLGYNEVGTAYYWWLRSPRLCNTECVLNSSNIGDLNEYSLAFNSIGIAFGFCIDTVPVNYTVVFNPNTGTGSMNNQPMKSNDEVALTLNSFTKSGYRFVGWNTSPNGTGTSYEDGEVVSKLSNTEGATINLYAQWEINPTKYAVQIYGINQDEDSAGNPIGLTFGPATGDNYNNKYVTHRYEEITSNPGNYYVKIVTHTVASNGTETTSEEFLKNSSGSNVIRTTSEKNKYDMNLHNMKWTEIANVTDKTKFLDCMLCGDTKSVSLTLNSTIASGLNYNQYGDGAGTLCETINPYYREWNPSYDSTEFPERNNSAATNGGTNGSNAYNDAGYSSSHLRATLIGENSKTDETFAGDVNLTTSTCLYSCIENDLKNVITAKKVKYITEEQGDSFLNTDISDKIWPLSRNEICQYGSDLEGIGLNGDGYDKFENNESKYYLTSQTNDSTINRTSYKENGEAQSWWLRTPNTYTTFVVDGSGEDGSWYGDYPHCTIHGSLAFGFCIN